MIETTMNIDWQTIFYITSSLAMIFVFLWSLFAFILVYKIIKLTKKAQKTVNKTSKVVMGFESIKKSVTLSILKLLLRFIEGKE